MANQVNRTIPTQPQQVARKTQIAQRAGVSAQHTIQHTRGRERIVGPLDSLKLRPLFSLLSPPSIEEGDIVCSWVSPNNIQSSSYSHWITFHSLKVTSPQSPSVRSRGQSCYYCTHSIQLSQQFNPKQINSEVSPLH